MSFATEVKKELLNVEMNEAEQEMFLKGLLQTSSAICLTSQGIHLEIKSHLINVLKYLVLAFRQMYNLKLEISYTDRKFQGYRIYDLVISEKANEIISKYQLMPLDIIDTDLYANQDPELTKAYVRGSFVAKGSINDPKQSNYHLEISCRRYEIAEIIQTALAKNYISSVIGEKKGQSLLYIKKAEEISNFLAYVGASSGVFYFEDSRIMRDLNNSVNRVINCDVANGNRSLKYCEEQLKMIAEIEKKGLTSKLSARLQDAIRLRKTYPDASLAELSELSENVLGKPLSKSGISHCFREIQDYYNHTLK